MEVTTAVELVNSLVYKPGWTIAATDHTNRFEGAIVLRIDYPADNTNRDQAPDGYAERINTYAQEPIIVIDCPDETALFKRVIEKIIAIETHEAREYFRVKPTFWAPFHPHRTEGMARWGNPADDLKFGIG